MKRNSHMESTERKSLHFLIFQYVLPVRVIWTTRAHTGPAAQRLDVWRICMCWESAAGRDSPIQQEYSRISKGSEVECWPPLYWQGFIPSVILDGIVQKLPTSHEVNTLARRRLQDLRRCPLLLYESKTVSLQEAAATHQPPRLSSSQPPYATMFLKGETSTRGAVCQIIYPLLLTFLWTITLLLLLCVVITFLYTLRNTSIIFVKNAFHFYSGKCYEHKTLLGAT